jgi:hypothetical protein
MWYGLAILLLILWLVGWLAFEVVGAAIHLLAVLALVLFVVAMLRKARRAP